MSTIKIDIRAFVNERKLSYYQWVVLFLCFLIVVADGMDVAIMGFIAPSIVREWGLSKALFGVVMSAAPFGLAIGAIVAGPLSDIFGRKKILMGSVLCFAVFTYLTSLSTNMDQMVWFRLLTGFGLGASMPNTTTLLSEYIPERSKSFLITLMFTGFNLGSGLIGFVAAYLIPDHGWASVLKFGAFVPLLLLPCLYFFLPESVRFMVVKNYSNDKISKTISRVCNHSFDQGTHFYATEPELVSKKPIKVLFQKGMPIITISLWVTYFMGLMVIYLLTGWLPTLIKDSGLSISEAANVTAMFQIGGTLGGVAVGFLMDRFRATRMISLAYLGGAILVLCVGLGGVTSGLLALIVALTGFCMSGAQTGLNAFAPTCYPTVARATGVSWMLGFGRFGSILGSMVGGILLSLGWGFGNILSILAIPAILAAIAMTVCQVYKSKLA